jgi:hypothetical protein
MIHAIYLGLNNIQTIIGMLVSIIVIIVIVLVIVVVVIVASVTLLFRIVRIRVAKVVSQMLEAGVVGIHNATTVAFL